MNLYVDDHLTGPSLAGLLRKVGHTVVLPADAHLAGVRDARHLEYAILHRFVVLTADRVDFRDLHDVIRASGGHHPGILIVRYDNDPTRDMKPGQIVRAVGKLQQAGILLEDQLLILNHWR